jgi:competence ComEA-like helix-hairpin-helix protein
VYTRTQLWLLLGLVVLAGLGIAVGNWRRTHVALAARIEQFDTGAPPSAPGLASIRGGPPGSGTLPASTTDERQQGRQRVSPAEREASRRGQLSASRQPQPAVRETPRRLVPVTRPAPRQADGILDLNRATIDDLVRLPGVGPALAERILSARAEDGRFESVDDLGRVSGIGPVKLARLRDLVTVPKRSPSR